MPANAGIQPCVAEILDSRLPENDKDRPRTIYLRRRPQNGLESLGPDDPDIITVISDYVDYFLNILFSSGKVGGLMRLVVRLIPLFPARAP